MFKGWENIPLHCLKLCVDKPFIHDIIKYDIHKWEFYVLEKKKKYTEQKYMGAYAGVINTLVTKNITEKTIFISGWLGPHDFEELFYLVPSSKRNLHKKLKEDHDSNDDDEEQNILLPGISIGYTVYFDAFS
jgi:hypothetical protein